MTRAAIPQTGGVSARHGACDGRAIQHEAGIEMLVEPRHRSLNRDARIALAASRRAGGGDAAQDVGNHGLALAPTLRTQGCVARKHRERHAA